MPPLAFRSVSRLSAAPSPQLGDDPPLLSSPLGVGGIRQRNPQKPSWQGPAHPPHCGCWPLRPLRLCCEGRPPEGGAGQTWAQVGGHGWGARVGRGVPGGFTCWLQAAGQLEGRRGQQGFSECGGEGGVGCGRRVQSQEPEELQARSSRARTVGRGNGIHLESSRISAGLRGRGAVKRAW